MPADVWINVGALLLYGAICFVIGVRLFRFKADNSGQSLVPKFFSPRGNESLR